VGNSGSSVAESNVDVEEDFYEIDAVIDRRVYKNKLQYLVRWKVSRCIQKSILMLGPSIHSRQFCLRTGFLGEGKYMGRCHQLLRHSK
jgi:hypothetical protein